MVQNLVTHPPPSFVCPGDIGASYIQVHSALNWSASCIPTPHQRQLSLVQGPNGSVGCVTQGQPFQIYDINMTHRVIYFGRAHTLQTPSDCGNSSRKLRRGMRKDVGFKIYCTTTTPRARFAAYNHCHHPSLHPQKRVVVATTIREILGTSTLLLLLLLGESEMTSKRATIALATLVYIISTHPPMLGKIYRINFGSICTALQSRVLLQSQP